MIYYCIYPFLRSLFARFGVLHVTIFSFLLALLTVFIPDHNHGNFFFFEGPLAPISTAILGLPIWLLGCLLAQAIVEKRAVRFSHVGLLRAALVILGFGLPILSFLDDVIPEFPNLFFLNTKYSFLLFSPIIYWWLYAEITQKNVTYVYRLLKPVGLAAYSIYLMHVLSIPAFIVLPINFNSYFNWVAIIFIALLMSTLFYFLVERPSHRLGRRFLGVTK